MLPCSWLNADSLASLQCICFQTIEVDQLRVQIHGIRYTESQEKGFLASPHQHDFFEFHYIETGMVTTSVNGVMRDYHDGQFYLMTPRSLHFHSNRSIKSEGHQGYALRWKFETINSKCKNPDMDTLNNILSNALPYAIDDDNHQVSLLFRQMLTMAQRGHTQTGLKLLFINILLLLSQCYNNLRITNNNEIGGEYENATVHAAITFIQDHCCEQITVNDVANHVHISYSHLSRLFLKYALDGVGSFITRSRIDRAQHLLLTSDQSISKISDIVGFTTISHFSTMFHKMTGMSPKEYRTSYNRFGSGIPTQL